MARKREKNPDRGGGRRRWRRRLVVAAAVLTVLVLAPVVVVRSGMLNGVILSRVGAAFGADVSASSLSIGSDATIVAEGVRVGVPGLAGPAGELFEAERVEVFGSWSSLLSGSGRFDELVLTRPRLRVSRDIEGGGINLSRLRVPTSDGGEVVAPPRILVREGVVELGEHAGNEFTLLRSLQVEGAAQPTEGDDGSYEIAFREGAVSGSDGSGLGLRGLVTADGITLELDGLDLARWGPENIPAQFRDVFALMRIAGGIPRASLRMASDGSTEGVIELDGVSMNLPFDAEGRPAEPDRLVRLRDVDGVVRIGETSTTAELRGMLGDLPSTVRMTYNGLRADSPFRCVVETKGFALESNPEILPLAPGIVKRRLADFSNPTATVDARVVVERGQATTAGPGAITVRGELAFRDGSAAFEGFPYLFEEMTGLARFDEAGIEIVSIDGVAPSGARLHASGTIIPPRSGAEVKIRVTIDDVPIDDVLLDAMGERRREVVRTLCHVPSYQRMREMDLLREPDEQGPGQPFALGGVGAAVIDIYRAPGEDSNYEERVEVRLSRLGLVPEPFPLPIIATDTVIVIENDTATITEGEFRGVSGGRAQVAASVDLTMPGRSGVSLRIDAEDVPADALLIAALPGGLDAEPDPRSPGESLRRLGVAGTIDCSALIGPRENGELGYDIGVSIDNMSASPRHAADNAAMPVELLDVSGRLTVSERRLDIELASRVASGAGIDGGTLAVDATLDLTGARPFEAEVHADVLDVGIAIEDLVSIVAPELAESLQVLRDSRAPQGGMRARVIAAGEAAEGGTIERLDVEVRACDRLRFNGDSARYEVSCSEGTITLSGLDTTSAVFSDWSGLVSLVGDEPGRVRATGRVPVGRPWAPGDDVSLSLEDLAVHSALVRRAVGEMLPGGLRETMGSAEVTGRFDADLRAVSVLEGAPPRVSGEIVPRRIAATLAGQRITADDINGVVTLDETGGRLEGLRVFGEGWWADLRGRWDMTAGESVELQGVVSGRSEAGLTPQVAAVLPVGLREALESLGLEVAGPLVVDEVELRVALGGDGAASHSASGRVEFIDASAEIGIGVQDASGYLDFESRSEPGTELSNFGIGVVLDEGQAAGVRFGSAAMRVTSDPFSESVLVPAIRADVHGGRLSGSAILYAGEVSTYEAELQASGVPLGELLADWEHAAGVERAAAQDEEAPERPDAESRGVVDAGLTLTGRLGDTESRRGRGRILVGGGEGTRVMRLPLLLPLIEVSNLQVPRNDPLDFGEAAFILDGDRLIFERVGVFAQSVEIFGYGQMWLPDLRLDLRFSSRATARLPVVSRIVEKLRDELIMTRVRGTVREPSVSTEQFTRTRRLLAGVIGDDLSPEERRMLEIERQSRESERREWRAPRPSGTAEGWGR